MAIYMPQIKDRHCRPDEGIYLQGGKIYTYEELQTRKNMSNEILVRELPWPTGEVAGLTKAEWDDFCVYYPADDSGFSKNIIFFAAKDKKGYETLVAKLQQIIIYIKQHNLECDCP